MFTLLGTPNQQSLVRQALDQCDFPFDRLAPKLKADTGRTSIPVEWADLSQWGAQTTKTADDHHDDYSHDHTHDNVPGEEKADPLEARGRVLGLAWYSGKVSLDLSLESDPRLAWEVFLAEGAHMVDFFYMTDAHREAVWDIFHPGGSDNIGGHGHGWFDVATYRDFVGESFMGGFIHAYAPSVPVTIAFTHASNLEIGRQIRAALTPELVEPPVVEPEPQPEPPPLPPGGPDSGGGSNRYFVIEDKKAFHDTHKIRNLSKKVTYFDTYQQAVDSGLRPCGVCKPQP